MTTSLLEKIFALLSADTAVTALVVDRIFPSLAEQDGERDYLVFEEVGGASEETHDDNATLDTTVIQFSCYSPDKDKALNLRKVVRACLTPAGAMAGVSVSNPVTRSIYEQETEVHNAILDLTFMHNPST